MSLAHSICARLHNQRQLAVAFFCRRDDPHLSEPRNILPTLIYKLARIFPPFRSIVANYLRNDPKMAPKSMKDSLLLDFLDNLPKRPNHSLVFVIDAFDECGDDRGRSRILRLLTGAATRASWLKIIITSRPKADIQQFFDGLTQSSYLRYDLATDQESSSDLRTFFRSKFETDRPATVSSHALARRITPEPSYLSGEWSLHLHRDPYSCPRAL